MDGKEGGGWGFFDAPAQYAPTRKGDGWQETIVTYEEWLSAQPPAQRIPQVGETWMTSNGQVKIVYASRTLPNDPEFQHFCGESPGGSLDIYLLEELKPFLSPSHLFAEAALKLIDEHITPSYSFHRLAGEISAGKLDAELAALGYTKTNQQ